MPLFQPNVVRKYIAALPTDTLANAWQIFAAHFHNPQIQQNIRAAKEEQYQEGFLRELFVGVFGYTLNPQPQYNLTTEYKNEKDSKKADGAILFEENVRAVIELKGTDTTDLSKIEKQAFGYLNNQKGCTYVITANFEKLRFYIQDATDFEEFNLFTLTQERFACLFLCLHKNNLQQNIPLTVKQQSLAQEDAITKKLYADYSRFRKALFENLVTGNPQHGRLELFQKTQKLLDRFLFILFAEDRMLLPPNFIIRITNDWKELKRLRIAQSLYSRFQLYFTDLLNGNVAEDIFAYNGGLFLPDDVLDNLHIDDELLLNGVLTLSNYDYNTEVDVNILGHIFEHSLNEIEALQSEAGAVELSPSGGRATRRKKEGVFYTPRYITKYIVENTVGALCIEKKTALQIIEHDYAPATKKTKATEANRKELNQKLEDYRAWLLSLTICDPACGSGAFLNAALEFLIAEHNYVDELTNKLTGSGTLEFKWTPNDILENNLFGVDINEEAVEIARLSLWLRTAQKGRKLSNLSSNIKCGNSLIDDKAVAGDKAFIWKEEFAAVFENGGFDVVIGNPPYVNSKGENFTSSFKEYWLKNFKTAIYQIDTYILFIEESLKIICKSGYISFIVPNAWLSNVFLANVRKYFLQTASFRYLTITSNSIFKDASVDTVIIGFQLKEENGITKVNEVSETGTRIIKEIDQSLFCKEPQFLINIHSNNVASELVSKIEGDTNALQDFFSIARGVGVYHKRVGHTKEFIETDPFFSNYIKDETFVPYLRGKDVDRFKILWKNDGFISYGKWLAEPREIKYFDGDRLILRQIPGERLYCTWLSEKFVIDQSVFIARNENNQTNTKYVLSLVASSLMAFYFRNKFSEFDELFPKLKLSHFKLLPIKSTNDQQPFIAKADIMLSKNKELQELKTGLLTLLRSKYEGITVSKKLADWPQLSFNHFLKELEKVKIKLSLTEQKEWLTYFENEKAKAAQLQDLISQTDKEIDAMVYELYGLTEEEIKIVEGA